MKSIKRDVTDIIDTEAKEFAIYSGAGRALPNMIDGFKPVHRFIVYRSLDLCKKSGQKAYHKLTSIAGSVSELGYHHTEDAAQDAAALLANTWSNNYPLLDGRGNFGSRIIKAAGASRYIYARISNNYFNVYKDDNICPPHEDIEHIPPKHFLPVIPTILLNGIRGVATGYACIVLPYDFKSVVECTKLALQGKLDREPEVRYPCFEGEVVYKGDKKYEINGIYKFLSKTVMEITEIPVSWDRVKYLTKILEPLRANGFITYEDGCDKDGFNFKVKFRKEYELPKDKEKLHDKIMKDFGLIEKVTQNLTVSDQNNCVKTYESPSELIKDFVEYRIQFVQKRIDHKIDETEKKLRYAKAKIDFIKLVISGEIVISGKKRKELLNLLNTYDNLKDYSETLISMNIYHMTSDETEKLSKNVKEVEKELKYWRTTTKEKEYCKDIDNLLS